MTLEVPYLPVYQKCCYFFSLRRGSIVIGWIFLILHLFLIGGVCVGINKLQLEKDERLVEMEKYNALVRSYEAGASQDIDEDGLQMKTKSLYSFFTFSMVLVLILCILDLANCALMLFGIRNERPRYMVAKLTTSGLGLILGLFGLIYYFIVCLYGMFIYWHSGPIHSPDLPAMERPFLKAFLISGGEIALNALVLYLWNVLYSYYRYLEVGRQESYERMTEMTA